MNKDALREIISDTIGNVGPSPALYLSGGVDSSIMLYELLQKVSCETLHVFTAQFFVPEDESAHALKVAKYFGIDHHHHSVLINLNTMLKEDLPLIH